jgi:glycopeptide antibiotics resistance protein
MQMPVDWRRLALIVLPLAFLALFPVGWLGEVYRPFGDALGGLNSVEAHAIGHIGIFFVLGVALLAALPALRRRPLLFFAIMLLVALGQEGFQLMYKQRPLVFDELRDLVTDVIGMVAAWAVYGTLNAER